MALVLATFVIVLGIILGIYWLMLVRPETAEDSAVLARVGGTTKAAKTVALLKAPQRLSEMPAIEFVQIGGTVMMSHRGTAAAVRSTPRCRA